MTEHPEHVDPGAPPAKPHNILSTDLPPKPESTEPVVLGAPPATLVPEDGKPVKIRIVSDGTCFGTKITTDDGRQISGVHCLRLRLDVNEVVVKATFEVNAVPFEFMGQARIRQQTAPGAGRKRRRGRR